MIDVTHICICLDYPKLYTNMATGNDVTSHENDLLQGWSVLSAGLKLAKRFVLRGSLCQTAACVALKVCSFHLVTNRCCQCYQL